MKEHAIGDRFDYDGTTLECVKQNRVDGCTTCYCWDKENCISSQCSGFFRKDGKPVVFKEVKKGE